MCSGENSLSKVLEFGKKRLDVSVRKRWIGSPLHGLHELVEVAPLESHQRAHAITEVGVQIDTVAIVVVEGTLNWLSKVGVRACTASIVSASAASTSVAGDTITEETVLAGTLETASGVFAGSIGMAIVSRLALLVHLAFVDVNAFAASLVVPVTNGASAFIMSAGGSRWTVLVARGSQGADESVTIVAIGALACVGVGISIGNAVRVLVAFAAWILRDLLADAVVARLVLAAINIVAWIGGLTNAVDVLKAVWTFAHALVVAVGVAVRKSNLATSAGCISAGIDVFLALVTISGVTIVADAVVVLLASDLAVWNA